MDPQYIFNEYVGSEVYEVSSVVCEADSSKSLDGKSLKFTVTDANADDTTYQSWYYITDGEDPTLGSKEDTKIITRADSSSDYAAKYFKMHDGISTSEVDYYGYFTVDGVGYDPGLGEYEVTNVTIPADTAGNKDGTYWNLYTGADQAKYVWYSKDTSTTDPNPGAVGVAHGIKVSYTTGDDATILARKTKDAMNDDIIQGNDQYFTTTHIHTTNSTAQVCTVVCVADVAGSLGGKYFTFGVPYTAGTNATYQTKYACWIDVANGSTAPSLPGYTLVEADISADATANAVATAVAGAIDALTGTGAGASTATVTITNTYKGIADAAIESITWEDKFATGFTFATTTPGVDPDVLVTNDQTGASTDATNGDTGVTVSVSTAGVDALNVSGGALEDYTALVVTDISADNTDQAVCEALHAAINADGAYTSVKTDGVEGYEENGLTGKTGSTATGLATTTPYYFKVNIDGAGVAEYLINTAADVTYDGVMALMNAELTGAAYTLVGGDLRCTSSLKGAASAIDQAAGATGADLFATLTDWVAFDAAVAGVAPYVTLTHPTKGNCTNSADGNVGGAFTVSTSTAGVDPTTSTITSMKITIVEDETATNVAIKTKAAIDAAIPLLMKVGISTATLTLTNRFKGVVADTADVDTGWTTITNTTQGTDAVETNAGQNVATAQYVYKVANDKVVYMRTLTLSLSDDDCTDAGKFGNLTALSNGCNIQICDKDGTVVKVIVATLKNNLQLCSLGPNTIQAGTNDTLSVFFNLVDAFGGEIPIDGTLGQYVEMDVNDNLNGLVGFYMNVFGHIKDSLGV